jgi:hypothetical protein
MADRAETYLWYGESDTGKTAQLGRLAKWHHERTGEISRLVSADSGWQSIDPELIWSPENPLGIIEAWNCQGLADPWAALIAVTEGEWPKVVISPDGKPKLRMVKTPMREGRLVGSGDRVIGQYLLEGISTFSNLCMQDHIRAQRKIGEGVVGTFDSTCDEEDDKGKVTVRKSALAKAAMSHYGHVQDFILLDLVPRTGRMPLTRVVWTGHEAKGDDDITGIKNSVLGPATVGRATVDRTVQKFGHSFHLTSETSFVGDKGKQRVSREFRAWFVKHPDNVLTRMMWPTKVSLSVEASQSLLAKFPGGYMPLTLEAGIEQFPEFLQAWQERPAQEPKP